MTQLRLFALCICSQRQDEFNPARASKKEKSTVGSSILFDLLNLRTLFFFFYVLQITRAHLSVTEKRGGKLDRDRIKFGGILWSFSLFSFSLPSIPVEKLIGVLYWRATAALLRCTCTRCPRPCSGDRTVRCRIKAAFQPDPRRESEVNPQRQRRKQRTAGRPQLGQVSPSPASSRSLSSVSP